MTFSGPGLNANDVITNDVQAGEFYGIALDLGGISQEQMQESKTKLETTKTLLESDDFTGLSNDDIIGDILYTTALLYYAELDIIDHVQAKTLGLTTIRYPSEAHFSTELSVYSVFGTPMSVSAGGLAMDVDRIMSMAMALDGNSENPKKFFLSSGTNGSILEHFVPEQLFSTPEIPAEGMSAIKALQIANDQGIPIHTINKNNVDTIVPNLQLDAETITDIKNAVNAGMEAKVSSTDITHNGWKGHGYIIIDPNTGAGAYMIAGGKNGALIYTLWWIGLIILFVLAIAGAIAIGALCVLTGVCAAIASAIVSVINTVISSVEALIAAISAIRTAILSYVAFLRVWVLLLLPVLIPIYDAVCSNVPYGLAWEAFCTILLTIILLGTRKK